MPVPFVYRISSDGYHNSVGRGLSQIAASYSWIFLAPFRATWCCDRVFNFLQSGVCWSKFFGFDQNRKKNDVAKPSDGLAFGSLRRFEIKLAQKNNASVSTYFLTMFFDAVHKKLDMGHWQFHVEVVAFPTRMAIAASR